MEEITSKIPESNNENVENVAEQISEAENTLTENSALLTSAVEEFEGISPEAKTKHSGAWDKLQAVRASVTEKIENSGHSVGEVELLAVAALVGATMIAPVVAAATVAGAGVYAISKTLNIINTVEA